MEPLGDAVKVIDGQCDWPILSQQLVTNAVQLACKEVRNSKNILGRRGWGEEKKREARTRSKSSKGRRKGLVIVFKV